MPQPSGAGLGDFEDTGYTTPAHGSPGLQPSRRGKHGSSDSQTGFSLADELAEADAYMGNASLLDELGLEPAMEINGHEEFELDEAFEDPQPASQYDTPTSPELQQSTPSRARRKPSVASLAAFSPTQRKTSNSSAIFEEEEPDLEFLHADLQASISSVDTFLSRIRTYTSDSSRNENLVYINTNSSHNGPDRQHIIEQQLSHSAHRLIEYAKLRDTQVRELKEVNHILASRSDPDWLNILAEVEDLPAFDTLSTTRTPEAPLPTTPDLHTSSQRPSLVDLRSCTTSLLSCLSSMIENAQLNRTTYNEASRKVKSIKSTLTNMKQEAESLERSTAFIESWEALQSGRGEKSSAVAWQELEGARRLFDQAGERAAKLLTVS